MNVLDHPIFYAAFMLVVGLGIPVFAALNGNLGARLQNPVLAAIIALSLGIAACLGVLLLLGKTPNLVVKSSIPFYYYLGGLFVVFYVLGMTWIVPKFGVGNAVTFVLLGQIISMAIIDHYSLLGAAYHPISVQRFVGIALMAIGVLMSVRG
jgi:transporter family-2 protein